MKKYANKEEILEKQKEEQELETKYGIAIKEWQKESNFDIQYNPTEGVSLRYIRPDSKEGSYDLLIKTAGSQRAEIELMAGCNLIAQHLNEICEIYKQDHQLYSVLWYMQMLFKLEQ